MANIAVVGSGYWGRNLIRNIYELGALGCVCDSDAGQFKDLKQRYPLTKLEKDYKAVLKDSSIDGVIISTPVSTHYQIARESLEAGKNIMVEKPFTTSTRQAEELVELAEKKGLVLMVGFTFLYNAAVKKVKELIGHGDLGRVYYIYSQRLNLGRVRQDVNAWWNLAPHDVSIILWWLGKKTVEVNARGFCYIQEGIEDVVMASIRFEDDSCAFIHTSWLDPCKIRKMTVVGSEKMVVYDDVSSDMKVQVYDKGIDREHIKRELGKYENFGQFQLIQRAGDIHIPKIDFVEPLKIECAHFLECIESDKQPFTSGEKSLEVVKVLEAVQKSLKNKGELVKL